MNHDIEISNNNTFIFHILIKWLNNLKAPKVFYFEVMVAINML